jgi:ABC-type multidrug transport system ATPase subunit
MNAPDFAIASPPQVLNPENGGASEIAIACRDLVYSFPNGTKGSGGITLEIRKGEFLCLLGANGAGKTTLIRQITTELRPQSGTITILGYDALGEAKRAKSCMGILPQSAGLFATLTVRQHVQCFAPLKGIPANMRGQAVKNIIDECALESLCDKRVSTLSLGQQRWVLVALAMLGSPPILILDEPTVGMDPNARRLLWSILKQRQASGTTILLTTHYLDEAERLADRIAFISHGRVSHCGTLADLYGALNKSVRVVEMDPGSGAAVSTALFHTLNEAQAFVRNRNFSSYAVGCVTLEDIYMHLTGHTIEAGE